MSAILAYNNRFHVTANKAATFASVDFDASPPLSNLGMMQLPLFAQFSGPTATLTCAATDGAVPAAAEAFDADVFAVLGLAGFDAGAQVEFLNGVNSLGVVDIESAPIGGNHAILALDAPVNLDTLTVTFTGAGAGVHRVGAVWASQSLRYSPLADVSIEGMDTGIASRSAGNTAWGYGGQNYIQHSIRSRTRQYLEWLTALQTAQSTNPVLLQLDQRLLSDALIKSYGLLEPGWSLNHLEAGIYDLSARLIESL